MCLRTQRLSGRLLGSTLSGLLKLQGPLIGFVVARLGDLRGQPRRLFERQFRQQDFQHPVESAVVAVGATLIVFALLRRAADEQDDFAAPEVLVLWREGKDRWVGVVFVSDQNRVLRVLDVDTNGGTNRGSGGLPD